MMKQATCIILMLLLTGCFLFKKDKTLPKEVVYTKSAIEVNLTADPMLNLYQNKAHALLLCIYELKDPNAFNQLLDEPGGPAKLMECNRFDPTVVYAKRLVIQPGEQKNEVMDRAEGSRYLAVSAGYYNMEKTGSARLYPMLSGKTKISLQLGPQAIEGESK